ncbi:hypothetical protein [Spirosoma sp.]|uniref:hypothetical protein n=1 Tax=Spirosoma sp. TaxID=1899569 RepID=UPI003B3B435E
MKTQKIPSGFRYLFTRKQLKELEKSIESTFLEIVPGRHLDTQILNSEQDQLTIHPVSLSGRIQNESWKFTIYQSGFRTNLLPESLETEVKNRVAIEISQYLNKANRFIDTDFVQHPQLWIYCTVSRDTVEIKTKEIR